MAYSSVDELPTTVRGALCAHNQRKWMDLYNSKLGLGMTAQEAYIATWHEALGWKTVRAVRGLASLDVVDHENERINQDALVSEINDTAWNYGVTFNDHHSNHPFGDWLFAEKENSEGVEQTAVYGVGRIGKPFFDEAWRKYILEGNKTALSIGIMKIDPYIKCASGRCWKQVDQLQIFEISAVPRGMCPGAELDEINFSAKARETPVDRAGDTTMSDTARDQPQVPASEPGDKSEPPGQAQGEAPAPDAGSLGTIAEGIQKLIGMTAELGARVDRIEAQMGTQKPTAPPSPEAPAEAPAEKADEPGPPEQAPPAAEEPAPPGDEAPAEPPAETPEEAPQEAKDEPEDEKEEGNKAGEDGRDCGCPDDFSDKAAKLVAANKEGRAKAAAEGTKTPRPELPVAPDSLAAGQGNKDLSLDERMKRYANMTTREMDEEAARITTARMG